MDPPSFLYRLRPLEDSLVFDKILKSAILQNSRNTENVCYIILQGCREIYTNFLFKVCIMWNLGHCQYQTSADLRNSKIACRCNVINMRMYMENLDKTRLEHKH